MSCSLHGFRWSKGQCKSWTRQRWRSLSWDNGASVIVARLLQSHPASQPRRRPCDRRRMLRQETGREARAIVHRAPFVLTASDQLSIATASGVRATRQQLQGSSLHRQEDTSRPITYSTYYLDCMQCSVVITANIRIFFINVNIYTRLISNQCILQHRSLISWYWIQNTIHVKVQDGPKNRTFCWWAVTFLIIRIKTRQKYHNQASSS